MKIIKVIIVTLMLSIMLFGCEKSVEKELPVKEENPFSTEEIEATGQEVSANYGWGIKNYDQEKRQISYDNGEIQLDIEFINSGPNCEVGIMLYIDGISQKYSNESNGKKDYIIPVKITEKKQTFSVYLKPEFALKGKNHRMFIACMYEPSYRDKTVKVGFGNYQKINAVLPWHILCTNSYNEEQNVQKGNDYSEITKEIKDEFVRKNEDGQIRNMLDYETRIKYFQSNKELEGISIDANKKFQCKLFGGEKETYRMSLFVDNQLLPVFSGKPYMDISLDKNQMITIDIESLSKISSVSTGSSMYVVLCPMGDKRPDEVYELIKLDSMVLVK